MRYIKRQRWPAVQQDVDVTMNAWLLTWEGTAGPALIPENKIVAILSSRRKSTVIEEFVDLIYSRSVDSAYDMALFANKRKARQHAYKHTYSTSMRLFYGRNPCIFARVVCDLTVQRDETREIERIRWTDSPYLRIETPGALPIEAAPAIERELVRRIRPLSRDIYEREV